MRIVASVLLLIGWIICAEVTAVSAQSFNAVMDSVQPQPPGTSFSASVIRDDVVRYVGSRGSNSSSAGERYMLASVTKQFTAAAILALEADGELSLDDSAAKFLKSLPHWDGITVRDLLSHQTTLPDYVSMMPYASGAAFQSSISLIGLLKLISTAAGTPRATDCISYSNSNYTTLARIVEVASNQSFGSYLHKKIFKPLAMNQTSYSGGVLSNIARGHRMNGVPTGNYHSSWANGAGGVVTTARDMAKWNIAILDGFLKITQRVEDDVVSGNCRPGGSPSRYAYGWIVGSNGILEHSGAVEGYATYNFIDVNQRIGVAVLTNFAGYSGGITAFARALAQATSGGGGGGGGSSSANYCCTAVGKFGPGPNPSGQSGLVCTWLTPWGLRMGQTCP